MMARAPRILIHYAWGHGSTGDMGIAPGMLALLKEIVPEAHISLFTMRRDEGYVETKEYLLSLFPDVKVYNDPFAPLLKSKDAQKRWWQIFNMALDPEAAVAEAAQADPEAVAAWREADLRLYTPSMQLTYHPKGGVSGLRFWLPVILAQRLGLPYALYGQSLGDIAWPGHEMLPLFLQDALMLTARDRTSLRMFQEAGVNKPQMGFVPDTTVFYEEKDETWADEYLRKTGLSAGEYLLVLPRTYGFWGVQPTAAVQNARMSKIAQVMEDWVNNTGQSILLAHELPREIERLQEFLWPLLSAKTKEHTVFCSEVWTAPQALAVYERASVMFSMERYAVFFAMALGLPTLHATTEELGLRLEALDEVGLGRLRVDIDQLSREDMTALLLELNAKNEEYATTFQAGAHTLRQMAREQMQQLFSRLDQAGV